MSRMLSFALVLALSPISIQPVTDADFMKKAGEVGVRDVEVSRLAIEKAANKDVKDFARRVAIDRSRVNEELLKLSLSRNVTLDAAVMKVDLTSPFVIDPSRMQPAAAQLSALEGPAFDRAFIEHVIKSSEEVIGLFDEEADHGKDKEVRDWAEKVHQTLQDLLKRAKDLRTNAEAR